ncbi:MAG: hypothetical protein LBH47_00880 [Christensenellaceae bacterium]|jgi:hypothetical protein|nr:hypothetical protein [Christensenellaceae bacterium]
MANQPVKKIYSNQFFNMIAFVAVIFIGVALLLGKYIGALNALITIAQVLAYITVCFYSYRYARTKKMWVFICWVIAVVLIILGAILNVI